VRLAVRTLVLSACLLAGCGSSDRAATRPPPAPASTTTAAAPLPGTGRPQVTIGDKNFTEQFVLGELYKQALSAKGYTVVLNPNIGPTEVTIEALQSGRIDMYPEYLGIWNTTVAGDKESFPSLEAAMSAGQDFAAARGFRLLRPTPFSDTDAIGVTRSYALANHLKQIGDLRSIAGMVTLGAPPQFQQRPTGLPALEQAYGFIPGTFKPLDVGSQYQALDQGKVQAADVNTTDAQLATGSYTLLADPLHVFGWGNVVPVVSAKVLAAEGPAFVRTIDNVSALLSTSVMRKLNAAVDIAHQNPVSVARQFLQAHGLVPTAPS